MTMVLSKSEEEALASVTRRRLPEPELALAQQQLQLQLQHEQQLQQQQQQQLQQQQQEDADESSALGTSGMEHVVSGFGYLRDGIRVAAPAVATGFGLAQAGTKLGFDIGKAAVSANFHAARWMGVDLGPVPQAAIEGALDFAHGVTQASIEVGAEVTKASMEVTDMALETTGARRGETVRALTDYVEAQRGVHDSYHTKEALLGLALMLGELSGLLTVTNPMHLMSGATALARLQREHRVARIRRRQHAEIEAEVGAEAGAEAEKAIHQGRIGDFDKDGDDGDVGAVAQEETAEELARARARVLALVPQQLGSALHWPTLPAVVEWQRYLRFASAAYGYKALHFLGLVPAGMRRWDLASDADGIRGLTGARKRDIAVHKSAGALYCPGHYVAVHHELRQVVVAIRGTMRAQDVLVDLVCEQTEFVSVSDLDGADVITGAAHKGFLRSAQRLANDLHEPVVALLRQHPGYELVLTGHSLGAGVATVLTLLWARMPFFRERNIRAFAFAAPCSVCHAIARAPFTRQHVTSIVLGDDIVSRLSIMTFKDLQRSMTALAPAAQIPVAEKADILHRLERCRPEDKLYSAGRVWWLESQDFPEQQAVEVDPVEHLNAIELSADMFHVHMPDKYAAAVESVLAETLARN